MNNNIRKIFFIILLITLLAIVFYVLLRKYNEYQKVQTQIAIDQALQSLLDKNKKPEYKIEGLADNLTNLSFAPGDQVSGKFYYSGTIKGGYFFEGSFPVSVLDKNKNVLKMFYATAIDDWMTAGPVRFTGEIDFGFLDQMAISDTQGYIRFSADDPKDGDLNKNAIYIPVRF